MAEETLISITEGFKRYHGRAALHATAMTVDRGDRVLLLGDNGSGKSTLLRVLAALTELDEGARHQTPAAHRLRIGYLPQEGGVYRDMTVAQNVLAYRRLLKSATPGIRSSALAERFGLTDQLHKPVGQLSGGFRRLAAIYCLLEAGTDALMLDEPSASLDAERQNQVYAVLAEVADRYAFIVACEHVRTQRNLLTAAGGPAFWTKTQVLIRPGAHEIHHP